MDFQRQSLRVDDLMQNITMESGPLGPEGTPSARSMAWRAGSAPWESSRMSPSAHRTCKTGQQMPGREPGARARAAILPEKRNRNQKRLVTKPYYGAEGLNSTWACNVYLSSQQARSVSLALLPIDWMWRLQPCNTGS